MKSPRAPKRLKDIIPDDVAVDCPVSSGAEDSDLDMSPSEPGKLGRARGERKKKKGGEGKKKRGDGWIWLESVSRGVAGEGKLAEYKRESKCVYESCRPYANLCTRRSRSVVPRRGRDVPLARSL